MKKLIELPMRVKDNLQDHIDILAEIQIELEKWMETAPEGSIHYFLEMGKMRYKIRRKDGPEKTLDTCKDFSVIQALIMKRYYTKVLRILKRGIPNVGCSVAMYRNIRSKIQAEYTDLNDNIKQFIDPIDISNEECAERWYKIPYNKPIIEDPNSDLVTPNGVQVRSKSEYMSAEEMERQKVYFKYERPIILSGQRYIPDFTIWDMEGRREIYWEHRGLLEKPEYAEKAVEKLRVYMKHGLILGDNLIITEETQKHQLGISEIRFVIAHYIKR